MGRRRLQSGSACRVRAFGDLHLVEVGLQTHALRLLQVHPLLVQPVGRTMKTTQLKEGTEHVKTSSTIQVTLKRKRKWPAAIGGRDGDAATEGALASQLSERTYLCSCSCCSKLRGVSLQNSWQLAGLLARTLA